MPKATGGTVLGAGTRRGPLRVHPVTSSNTGQRESVGCAHAEMCLLAIHALLQLGSTVPKHVHCKLAAPVDKTIVDSLFSICHTLHLPHG